MTKLHHCGMKAHAGLAVAMSVERVAKNRTSQTRLMGAMHTQLMGPACKGIETDKGAAFGQQLLHTVIGNGLFAILIIHTLAWTIHDVGYQGQGDSALANGRTTIEDCLITLFHLTRGKLTLKVYIYWLRLGENKQTTGVHVETVNGLEEF